MTIAGGEAGIFDTESAVGTFQNLTNISLNTAKTGLKEIKSLGKAGFVLTGAVADYEVVTGHDNTHTWVDLGVIVVGVIVLGAVGAAGIPTLVD